jgi:hypothetical protein
MINTATQIENIAKNNNDDRARAKIINLAYELKKAAEKIN